MIRKSICCGFTFAVWRMKSIAACKGHRQKQGTLHRVSRSRTKENITCKQNGVLTIQMAFKTNHQDQDST